jgi:hypothetical protein
MVSDNIARTFATQRTLYMLLFTLEVQLILSGGCDNHTDGNVDSDDMYVLTSPSWSMQRYDEYWVPKHNSLKRTLCLFCHP